ncbi:hypothetical protein ACFWII_23355 [Streptomyces sp. NPDC127063]|uniref:hypothetical protein n=1 Tax=Streptomyces sp. NPDC127063 TaxID=3347123 RepID=UPI00364E2AFB
MDVSEGVAALWAAGIGVAASAVASLISAWAAKQQAEIGARAQLEAVRIQAAEAHSQEKKRRQQAAYADLYASVNALREACVDAVQELKEIAVDADLYEADASFSSYDQSLHSKSRELWRAYTVVGLEGPEQVDNTADKVMESHEKWVQSIFDLAKQIIGDDERNLVAEAELTARISERESEALSCVDDFVNEAQKVLG